MICLCLEWSEANLVEVNTTVRPIFQPLTKCSKKKKRKRRRRRRRRRIFRDIQRC